MRAIAVFFLMSLAGLGQRLPSHVKLMDGPSLPGQTKKPTTVAPKPRPAVAGDTRCAHITVVPVTPDVDPKIIAKVPLAQDPGMPIYQGLPACSKN